MKEFCFIDNDFPDFRLGNLENKYMYTSKCNCDGSVQSGAAAVSHYCLSNIEYPNTECTYILDIYLLYIHTQIYVFVYWRVREHVAIYFNFLNSHLRRKQSHRLDVTSMLEHAQEQKQKQK